MKLRKGKAVTPTVHKAGDTRERVLCGLDRFDGLGNLAQHATMFDDFTCPNCAAELRSRAAKQAEAQSAAMRKIAAELADVGAEFVAADVPGEEYVDVPTGDRESLQIEHSTVTGDAAYEVYARRWAPDHGLDHEALVAYTTAGFAGPVVRGVAAAMEADAAAVEQAMTPPGEDEE